MTGCRDTSQVFAQQAPAEIAADEAGAAGDEDAEVLEAGHRRLKAWAAPDA
jgi:hypothetical protein